MGNILHSGNIICSAIIIGKSWLLVQGFCVTSAVPIVPSGYTITPANKLTITLGTAHDNTVEQLPVSRIVLHPDFNYSSRVNNLALVKLSTPLTYNSIVGPVKIDTRTLAPQTSIIGLAYPQPGTYEGMLIFNAVQAVTAPAATYTDLIKAGTPLDSNAVVVAEKDTGGSRKAFDTNGGIFTEASNGSHALLSLPLAIMRNEDDKNAQGVYLQYRLAPAVAWMAAATGISVNALSLKG
ncbi:hypothetical protein IWQ60_000576 [Tieghemiomyces parasiticus]|uniref:Peptidase S1 domain-containing protein n=1 Tax=Tieghemiomyces parasiticus TaxID=78921 RepID=A0A9W8AI71_9FUNG|nr:hypothetical protein IWQ60_000576 [Tieghemiomyces parasiticus]